MNTFALVAVAAILGALALQAMMGWGFARRLFRRAGPLPADEACPKAAVVLCLRGSDPFLPACLDALLRLDYPEYDIHIIIDAPDDPAGPAVARAVAGARRPVTVRPLRDRRDECSLKCSSLLQAAAELDESYEVLALLDADTIPHPNWLRELVAPLADAACGAATGNRWYMPSRPSLGALVRYLWNAGAVLQMYRSRIAWGGSLALKARLLRQSDLLDRWGHALCEDTMVYDVLRRQGLHLAFVPSVMMINREDCDLGSFFRWMVRQLLCARLYHSRWYLVVFQWAVSSAALVLAAAAVAAAAAAARWADAAWVVAALAAYQLGLTAMLAVVEVGVRRVARARGEPTGWGRWGFLARLPLAIPLTQAVYTAAVGCALSVRRVEWRGVLYEIRGPWDIHLVEYQPYRISASSAAGRRSL